MRKVDISQSSLYVAWLVSIIATLGSLYFSEIRGFTPCELCWYQRILMYPLSLILGIATFQNDRTVKKYVLPMAIIGGSISGYHYLQQKVPGFAEIKPCANGVPCSAEYINWFGLITIPFLALIAFIFIVIMLVTRKEFKEGSLDFRGAMAGCGFHFHKLYKSLPSNDNKYVEVKRLARGGRYGCLISIFYSRSRL